MIRQIIGTEPLESWPWSNSCHLPPGLREPKLYLTLMTGDRFILGWWSQSQFITYLRKEVTNPLSPSLCWQLNPFSSISGGITEEEKWHVGEYYIIFGSSELIFIFRDKIFPGALSGWAGSQKLLNASTDTLGFIQISVRLCPGKTETWKEHETGLFASKECEFFSHTFLLRVGILQSSTKVTWGQLGGILN